MLWLSSILLLKITRLFNLQISKLISKRLRSLSRSATRRLVKIHAILINSLQTRIDSQRRSKLKKNRGSNRLLKNKGRSSNSQKSIKSPYSFCNKNRRENDSD